MPGGSGDAITVRPLPALSRDGLGLLEPARTGFAAALWGPDDAAAVEDLILAHRDGGVPEARALFHRLLLADTQPPAGTGSAVLVARVDRLLEAGALDDADALIARAGPDTPDLFRRWFDVGLLLDRAGPPCAALRQNPSLSPTLPARVFCLARSGDWNAAEITLTLGEQVGSIDDDQQALLARFLDPVIFEGEPEPPIPEPLTALDFLMREAIGLDRPPGQLPLAFLHTDLNEHAPMRTRVEAAERLAVSGAIDPALLFAAYRSGVPAASGGIWDRAAAVQALDAALADPADADLATALPAADAALSDRGLRVALAAAYGPALAALDPAALAAAGARRALRPPSSRRRPPRRRPRRRPHARPARRRPPRPRRRHARAGGPGRPPPRRRLRRPRRRSAGRRARARPRRGRRRRPPGPRHHRRPRPPRARRRHRPAVAARRAPHAPPRRPARGRPHHRPPDPACGTTR